MCFYTCMFVCMAPKVLNKVLTLCFSAPKATKDHKLPCWSNGYQTDKHVHVHNNNNNNNFQNLYSALYNL